MLLPQDDAKASVGELEFVIWNLFRIQILEFINVRRNKYMSKIRIAINGFGRIGRTAFQKAIEQTELEVIAINDLTDNQTLAHLLKYDSVYGIYTKEVGFDDNNLIIDGKRFKALAEKDPTKLPWKELEVDVVLECTGFFTLKEEAEKHLQAGAKKVIISAPSKSENVPTFIMGVNEEKCDPKHDNVISNASCTTNALAPVAKVLNDNFKISKALMTTIHSYTSTQNLVDGPSRGKPDLRRARAAALSMVPTTTGAAIATTKVLPELKGKIDGRAIRIPTSIVSIVDLVAEVEKNTTTEEVNKIFQDIAQGKLKGILDATSEPLVSIDYRKNEHSAIIDLPLTMVEGENLIKVFAWYDNEWGYSCRLVDMAVYVGKKLKA